MAQYIAQELSVRTGQWLAIGDIANTMEEAAGYIGRCAAPDAETRIVFYLTEFTEQNISDRLVN